MNSNSIESNDELTKIQSTETLINTINDSNQQRDALLSNSTKPLPNLIESNVVNDNNQTHNHSKRIYIGAKPNNNNNNNNHYGLLKGSPALSTLNGKGFNWKNMYKKNRKSGAGNSSESFEIGGARFETQQAIERQTNKRKEAEALELELLSTSSLSPPPPPPILVRLTSQEVEESEIFYDASSTFNFPLNNRFPLPKSILRTRTNPISNSLLPPAPPLVQTASFLSLPLPLPVLTTRNSLTKSVQFETPTPLLLVSTLKSKEEEEVVVAGDDKPLPILEVLSRLSNDAGIPISNSSSSSNSEIETEPKIENKKKKQMRWKEEKNNTRDVLKSEKMLVKVGWTAREDISDSFDETNSRKLGVQYRRFEEFLVVWGRRKIELYSTNSSSILNPFQKSSSPKLIHSIPLHPYLTKLSLFSPTSTSSLIFSLHHPSSLSPSRTLTNLRKKEEKEGGTDIYLFRPRINSRGREWMWNLRLALGGKRPLFLEIKVPGLGEGVRIKIPVPSSSSQEGEQQDDQEEEDDKPLEAKMVVEACLSQLVGINDWKDLLNQLEQSQERVEIKLSWRNGNELCWIEDGDDTTTTGGLLSGLAVSSPEFPTSLELRQAVHYPTTVFIPSTPLVLSEPTSIEGYVNRIKSSSGTKGKGKSAAGGMGGTERIYLSSHEGFLWILRPSLAGAPTLRGGDKGQEEKKEKEKEVVVEVVIGKEGSSWKKFWRGSERKPAEVMKTEKKEEEEEEEEEIMREREEKKRCRDQIMKSRGFIDLRKGIKESRLVLPELAEMGVVGEGGVRELSRAERSLIVILSNGKELEFECNSRVVALEWVTRLTALSQYWQRRQRVDGTDQMEFQPSNQASLRQRNVIHDLDQPSRVDNKEHLSPLLSSLYNRCLTNGCRSIIHHGTFYVKIEGEIYQERYLFLLPSSLLQYRTIERTITGLATPSLFHTRTESLNLHTCYIYAGILTESFWTGEGGGGGGGGKGSSGRIYLGTDGLNSYDEEEECTFVLFKKEKGNGRKGTSWSFRARSKIERDVWIYAIDSCLERLIREEEERE